VWGSFGDDPPVKCGVRPTSATQVAPSAWVRCDLPRTTPYYGELLHADVSWNLWNSVRELSDLASIFPNYRVAHFLSVGATRYDELRYTCFLRSCCSERPNPAGY